jgi:hypothetical protein
MEFFRGFRLSGTMLLQSTELSGAGRPDGHAHDFGLFAPAQKKENQLQI